MTSFGQVFSTGKPYQVLIAGSREIDIDGILKARVTVEHIFEQGYRVVCGDNLLGIDATVIDWADELGCPITVYGISLRPRKGSRQSNSYKKVWISPKANGGGLAAYLERDRKMIGASDECIFIHNGVSQGTRLGYEYAKRLGKPTQIFTFTEG